VNHIEGNFRGVQNADIYYQAWLPKGEARAVLLVVHGLGEHCGRYMNVVDHFVPLGYAVYGFDHVGHGRSEGEREVVERFSDYTETLAIYLEMVKAWQPDKPIFLLGHSMGGLIVPYYLLDHQDGLRGAVISAPFVKIGDNISQATILMARVLSALAPRMGLVPLDASGISSDPQVVQAYVNDPLVFHGKTPARVGAEMLKAMLRVEGEAHGISLPFIVVQGSEDQLVDPGGAQMLLEKAGSADKTIRIYEGLHHEVFNEPERSRVLEDVEAWLAAHIPSGT
jgi:alpha-beta hydrolase superfamily lysophospholipase